VRDDVATDGPFATDEMAYSLGADGTLAVALFGLPDERLSIAHDAGGSPTPYVAGTLVAAGRRAVCD
jgi:hypothetical protein